MTDDIRNQFLDQVAEMMAGCQPNSMNDQRAKAEFHRHQTLATQETAVATRRYTFYMLISVLLLFVSVLGSLVFDYLNYRQYR